MSTERDKTREGLKMAIQMEIDGKDYYLQASQRSSNELGRKLLKVLAGEEDIHRQKFTMIYDAIRSKQGWPAIDFLPQGGKALRTIFAQATEKMNRQKKVAATEFQAIKTAMAMEIKTYDFYQDRSQKAAYGAERDFYKRVAAEEQVHHLILLDYDEYLKDPAAWFVKKEHPSLDGG